MKLAITSDFHLGYQRFYDDSFVQAKRALNLASSADIILLAGDIFDTRMPKQEIFASAFDIFASVSKPFDGKITLMPLKGEMREIPNVKIAAIHGTHERRPKDFVSTIQVMEKAGFLIDSHASAVIFEKDGEKIAIQGLGGVPEQFALAGLTTIPFKPVDGAFNIFMFHQTMQEFVPAKNEMFITKKDLPKGFDLYLCGHIHWVRKLDVDGKELLIPGSTVVTQLRKNEMGEKGVIFYDTKTRKHEFKPIETRAFAFKEIEVKDASPTEIYKKCEAEILTILKKEKDMPIIKLNLNGTLAKSIDASNIDLTPLLKQYSPQAIIEIDKSFELEELKEQMDYLQKIKSGQISIKDHGLQILIQQLQNSGISTEKTSDLFELLTDEDNIEKVISFLTAILN